MKILSNSHRSAPSYAGFTPLRKAECDPLSVPFCFEYTNILCISMSDRMQNLQIFIFSCMGKKQLELKMLRMKKSLNRSNYAGHINSSAFRHFIQMLQSTLENINRLKKTLQIFFHNWKINHYKQHLGIINILPYSWINKVRKKSDQNPEHFQIHFLKLKACVCRGGVGGKRKCTFIYIVYSTIMH